MPYIGRYAGEGTRQEKRTVEVGRAKDGGGREPELREAGEGERARECTT